MTYGHTNLKSRLVLILCLFLMTVAATQFWKSTGDRPTSSEFVLAPADNAAPAVERPDQTSQVASLLAELTELDRFETKRMVADTSPAFTTEVRLPITDEEPRQEPAQFGRIPRRLLSLIFTAAPSGPDFRDLAGRPAEVHSHSCWAYPAQLIGDLAAIRRFPELAEWSREVQDTVHRLRQTNEFGGEEVEAALSRLNGLVLEGQKLANAPERMIQNGELTESRPPLQQAVYALKRRLVIWQQVRNVMAGQPVFTNIGRPDLARLFKALQDVESYLADNVHANAWNEYLLLDDAFEICDTTDATADVDEVRQLAQQILNQMNSPYLNDRQRRLLWEPVFVTLARELRAWAGSPIDYARLLSTIERYEQSSRSSDAERLAKYCLMKNWSDTEAVTKLGGQLDQHYRNANIRVAISAELINRLLPAASQQQQAVNDTVLGARVLGRANSTTELRISLLPDPRRWRMGLHAEGAIRSRTSSVRGPATFFNEGFTRYQAQKSFSVDRHGVQVSRAETNVAGSNRLKGFETDFDELPLVGLLARSIAEQQHDSKAGQAEWLMRNRVASEASKRLDDEVHYTLLTAEKEFQEKILDPLHALELNPLALSMRTTEQRLIARYRLAGDLQLAAHTARPVAYSDSLLSLQVHQSAVNNSLQNLRLEGTETDLHQLWDHLTEIFKGNDLRKPEDLPDNVTVRFADEQAVRVDFEEGRAVLTIKLDALRHASRSWKNVIVRGFYRPDPVDTEADLVRDGYIELSGKQFGLRDQIALRGIFTKVLNKEREFSILSPRLLENERLSDLQLTQFDIRDGWIGVALGPKSGVHR